MTLYHLSQDARLGYLRAERAYKHGISWLTDYAESGDALLCNTTMFAFWRLPRGTTADQMVTPYEFGWGRTVKTFSASREHCAILEMAGNVITMVHFTSGTVFALRCADNSRFRNPTVVMTDDKLYIASGTVLRRQRISVCDVRSDQLVKYKYDDFSPVRLQVREGMLYTVDAYTNAVCTVDCRIPTVPITHSEVPYRVMAINAGLCSDILLLHHYHGAAWYDLRACAEYEYDDTMGSRAYV